MIGTLVQKVSDIETKYEQLRGKAMDEDSDSVCENSMNTAPGRGEEDACSSVSARGRGGEAHTSRANRVGTDDKVQMAAPGAAARTHTQTHTLSAKVISVST